MIEQLLQEDIQAFIEQHKNDDEQQLLLRHKSILNVPASLVIWQISGKRKAKTKLPLYFNTAGIVYPPGVNLEQSSSEETATFKASILDNLLNTKQVLIDLTGGFGVDSLFFSKVFQQVKYIEPNAALIEYAQHNHKKIGVNNISYFSSSAEEFLKDHSRQADCFFIDPSRRTNSNQKVFKLADCEPNIVQLQPEIFKHTQFLLVKTSPMLDLQQGLSELKFVKAVWVVAVQNEVKELLFFCQKDFIDEPVITAINLGAESEPFSFTLKEEKNTEAEFSNPLAYLYEPNASVLKSGAFKLVAHKFSLKKLHPSTHLYTGAQRVENFPGRIFRVNNFLKADIKSAAQAFPLGKANVITRNYPLSPDELKKKLKLKDGGDQYLIACSGEKEKFLIAAERLK